MCYWEGIMPPVFISYSSVDKGIAEKLYNALNKAGADPFLAEVDLRPGEKWKDDVLKNLKRADWVFFLATPNSCQSQPVMHEIGASLVLQKKFIPIMWNVTPNDLPEWVRDRQAIDLKNVTEMMHLIQSIGKNNKSDKFWGSVLFGVLVCFSIWILTED